MPTAASLFCFLLVYAARNAVKSLDFRGMLLNSRLDQCSMGGRQGCRRGYDLPSGLQLKIQHTYAGTFQPFIPAAYMLSIERFREVGASPKEGNFS